jgi:hypothetical protein
MNPNAHNSLDSSGSGLDRSGLRIDGVSTGEDTLRLIAGLPSPEGLEGRVRAALRTAPRQGWVLTWPFALRSDAAWVRAAAAAAIVMVVAGGGWGVYSHIQPWQPAKAGVVPSRAGQFSGASAVRSPQSLQPPVVSAAPKAAVQHPVQKKTRKKNAAPAAQTNGTSPASK